MAVTTPNDNTKLSLKLLIDTKSNKVVFAEAGKEFVDFLFHLLSLPAGTVIKLLTKSEMVGCIADLYESLENLDVAYMQPNQNKNFLLNPSTPTHIPNFLLPDAPHKSAETRKKFYGCSSTPYKKYNIYCSCSCSCVTDKPGTTNCDCNIAMYRELKFIPATVKDTSTCSASGYVKGLVTYMVMDDLSVSPMSMISGVGVLNKFNIKDFGVLHEKVVDFGMNQAVDLLKASLLSKTALTDVFLAAKPRSNSDALKSTPIVKKIKRKERGERKAKSRETEREKKSEGVRHIRENSVCDGEKYG